MAQNLRPILFVLCLSATLPGCGPMNHRPPPTSPVQENSADSVGITKTTQGFYMVHVGLKGSNNNKADLSLAPQLGSNTYVVRFLHADTLKSLSKEAKVTAEVTVQESAQSASEASAPAASDPSSETAAKTAAAVTAQEDGTFLIDVSIAQSGQYALTLTVSDQNIEDTYVVQIQL